METYFVENLSDYSDQIVVRHFRWNTFVRILSRIFFVGIFRRTSFVGSLRQIYFVRIDFPMISAVGNVSDKFPMKYIPTKRIIGCPSEIAVGFSRIFVTNFRRTFFFRRNHSDDLFHRNSAIPTNIAVGIRMFPCSDGTISIWMFTSEPI